MRISYAGLALVSILVLAGCQRTTYGRSDYPAQPAPLTPAPVGGVEQSQLPPPDQSQSSQFPAAPTADGTQQDQQMASIGGDNAPKLDREALIGRWTATSSGASCDMFLSLTKWTGGYRAASRNCSGTTADVSAWDVKNNQVVLSDNVGNQIAVLARAGKENYSGTTATGQPMSLSR